MLKWQLRYEEQSFSIDAGIAKGRELPEWYINAPEVKDGDMFYLGAFSELSTCRTQGPIPWDKIILYANTVGLSSDLFDHFLSIIRAMDSVYLSWASERAKEHGRLQHQGRR